MNSLGYDSLNEVFFDVFEIKSNNLDFIKEKKGEINGNPIIELDLCIDKKIYKNVRFVLKESNGISVNLNLLDPSKAIIQESIEIKKSKKKKESILIESKTSTDKPKKVITEKTKKNLISSIKEELINNLKEEIKAGIIADLLKDNIQSNFDNILKEDSNQYKLQKLFQNENNKFRKELIEISEKIARRESLRFAESGGGTNAVQYANGGTMNGDLVLTGNLSANVVYTNTNTAGDGTFNNLIVNGITTTDELHSNVIKTKSGINYAKKQLLSFDGNGIDHTFILTHNLSTYNITADLYDANTNEKLIAFIQFDTINTLTIDFDPFIPQTTDKYNVMLIF